MVPIALLTKTRAKATREKKAVVHQYNCKGSQSTNSGEDLEAGTEPAEAMEEGCLLD